MSNMANLCVTSVIKVEGHKMTKKIKLFATLRDIVHAKEITVDVCDGQTVAEILESIRETHPELVAEILKPDGELTGLVHILVHGRNMDCSF